MVRMLTLVKHVCLGGRREEGENCSLEDSKDLKQEYHIQMLPGRLSQKAGNRGFRAPGSQRASLLRDQFYSDPANCVQEARWPSSTRTFHLPDNQETCK